MDFRERIRSYAGRPPGGMDVEVWVDVVAEASVAIAEAQCASNNGTPEEYATAALRAALPRIRANLRRRERAILDRVDDVVRQVGTLTPRNPADLQAIVLNLRIATTASTKASEAARYARRGMFAEAEQAVAAAEKAIAA